MKDHFGCFILANYKQNLGMKQTSIAKKFGLVLRLQEI